MHITKPAAEIIFSILKSPQGGASPFQSHCKAFSHLNVLQGSSAPSLNSFSAVLVVAHQHYLIFVLFFFESECLSSPVLNF